VVVTYNANLFECQWKTLQADIEKAGLRLLEIRRKIEDRKNGLIKKGKAPTPASIKAQCKEALSREYLKEIITYTIDVSANTVEKFDFTIDQEKLKKIADTYLGKNILISNRELWSDEAIIRGYRSQYIIEEVFKESKDRKTGTWWPQYHWTDSKIHVHALYCTIALLLRALMKKRVENAGVKISMKRLLTELEGIREVVNVYSDKKTVKNRSETVLSRLSETQETLSGILGMFLKEKVAS
jgi:transposase